VGLDQGPPRAPRRAPRRLSPPRGPPQQYVNARILKFGYAFARRLAPGLNPQQIDYLVREVATSVQAVPQPVPMLPQHNLRLVLRHDCQ
jgi:hypothetical protein